MHGGHFESRFLFTPCEDNTEVDVLYSQAQTHAGWVGSTPCTNG